MSKITAAARADAATIAAAQATSPQSQLAVMAGTVPAINPQGETARFLLADIKGKDAAASYRLSVIRTAVLELLKGNPRNLREAIDLSAQLGKGKKARAYAAGFAPLMDLKALGATGLFVGEKRKDGTPETARTGKWSDSAMADVRTKADMLADAYTAQFASAHALVMAEKPVPKAKKATAPEAVAAVAAANASADSAAENSGDSGSVTLEVSDMVDTVVTAIQQGMLSAEELVMIRAALAATEAPALEGADAQLHHLLTAAPVLLAAQAH